MRKDSAEKLSKKKGKHRNISTGEEANISGKSIDKLTSGKALLKSLNNGFTAYQHFETVSRINKLYENSKYVSSAPDRNGSPDVVCVKRYEARFKFKNGKKAKALITVKQYKNEGDKIYSLELIK